MKKRMLSGIKPTGKPHIGNYFGAMKQFLEYQNDYEAFVMMVDLHALTSVHNAKTMKENTRGLLLDYLAVGLDPNKISLFKQSDVHEHAELAWIFECITTMPYLMRAHAFKDAQAKNKELNVGTFNYPMLMAADILLYSPDVVPVGKDQKQHVEFARDTVEKFNRIFETNTFKLPTADIREDVAVVPGVDGRKMSKSYGNVIPLFATDEELKKICMSVVTASNAKGTPNDPTDTLFSLISLFVKGRELDEVRQKYSTGEMGYKTAKELLFESTRSFIDPIRTRRAELAEDQAYLDKVLRGGAEKARVAAGAKMVEVKKAVGLL